MIKNSSLEEKYNKIVENRIIEFLNKQNVKENKMKVIDILNKIANGEEVPKFMVCGDTYYFDDFIKEQDAGEAKWFIDKWWLNEEAEIIEEDKKIEKIDMFDYFTGYDFNGTSKDLLKHLERNFEKTNEKLNEIIDYINRGKK